MTSKYEGHTPGPWHVEAGSEVSRYQLIEIADKELVLFDAPGDNEAAHKALWLEHEANAALLTDAPLILKQRDALREAVEMFVDEFADYLGHHEPDGCPLGRGGDGCEYCTARAALALCDETEADPASIQQQKGGE